MPVKLRLNLDKAKGFGDPVTPPVWEGGIHAIELSIADSKVYINRKLSVKSECET